MGLHAFDHEPAHCGVYRERIGKDLPRLRGLEERWNMPTAHHRRNLGPGVEFDGVDHYILTYHIDGGSARRTDRVNLAANNRALSLQKPESAGKFASQGVVEYAHMYFRQSLLCEVADECGLSHLAEPEDFFALYDSSLSLDVMAYLDRAGDDNDRPQSMEMDIRAYLIATSLLRAVRAQSGQSLELSHLTSRPDIRIVLKEIEDRLDESLRLSDLAARIGMSPFHFARVFKAEVGETPAKYVQNRRIDRALEMIRRTKLPFADIAFRAGFSSQSHMSRQIKTLTGLTPSQIRKSG